MNNGFRFLLDIAIILLFANIGGYISAKLKQPAVLGQIIAGLILGPSILNLVGSTDIISHLAEVGVIMLMFIAGLETDLKDLKASSKSSSLIALGGVTLPLILGIIAMMIMSPGSNITEGLFVGVILTATSVSITVETLRDLKKLSTKQGIGVLGAAIMDDVVGIILVSLVAGIAVPSQGTGILIVVAKIAIFFIIALVAGVAFSKILTKYAHVFNRKNRVLSSALIFCFVMAFIAEEMGVAAIIGAYLTGVIFSVTPHRDKVSREIQSIAYSIFTPIFFINIGLTVQLQNAGTAIGLSIVIILVAIIGKIVGCGVGAKLSGFNTIESMQVGIGMIPRSEVALIVTNLGIKLGIIGNEIFTAIILMVLVTTIATPPLLKYVFAKEAKESFRLAAEPKA